MTDLITHLKVFLSWAHPRPILLVCIKIAFVLALLFSPFVDVAFATGGTRGQFSHKRPSFNSYLE